jgi:argininosuccinate lyase
MKLWQKDKAVLKEVEQFTVGTDREMDIYLAAFDVLGSLAHAQMLHSINLLTENEWKEIKRELKLLYGKIEAGNFQMDDKVEDIHSQIELLLTEQLGDTGKKIHAARSRNDQVLLDIRLFIRNELEELVNSLQPLFVLLQKQSETHKAELLPGYTHLQIAMPSSFGLWFGAYAESLADDLILLRSAYDIANRNPLGSAAGYGSSFPVNRTLTTELLGFESLNYNVVYAQMGRGKVERIVAQSLSNVAETLAKLSMDACLYMSQNFGFISFPEELTTGSSIMPHKKNPDVFELIRAHCNRIKSIPNEITMITTNLPSGYHRDLQLLKQSLFPAFTSLKDCIKMTGLMISAIEVKTDILSEEKYKYLFTVEEVNRLVNEGMPFRDAYKKVAKEIADGNFHFTGTIQHVHEGSIGNLCTDEIRAQWEKVYTSFPFDKVQKAVSALTE